MSDDEPKDKPTERPKKPAEFEEDDYDTLWRQDPPSKIEEWLRKPPPDEPKGPVLRKQSPRSSLGAEQVAATPDERLPHVTKGTKATRPAQ